MEEGKCPVCHRPFSLLDAEVEAIRKHSDAGMTQSQIAEIFGISQPHVSRIINNKRRVAA